MSDVAVTRDDTPRAKARNLLAQTLQTFGSMAGNQGLQIAAGIALSRVYGPPGKGAITYAGIAILGVVAIADGLASAIARECGQDGANVRASYEAALRIVLLVSALAVAPLIVLGWLVPAQRALLYVGIAFPFALYAQTMAGFHLLALRVGRTNAASLVINAGAALVMLVVIVTHRPPIDVILGIWTAGYVGGAAIIWSGLGGTRADAATVRQSFALQSRFALRASSAALMTFLASRVDVFIVAATLSASALGNYTLALAVGELMWQVSRAISWSAYGRVATIPFNEAAALAAKITRIVLALELLAALVGFAIGPRVFTFVYGPAFAAAGPVLRILIPGMALYAADAILSYFLAVKVGRPGTIFRIEAATLVLCAVGSLATIGRFGIVAPAIATSLAYLASFTLKAFLFARATGLPLTRLLLVTPADLRRGGPPADRIGPAAA